MINRTLGISLLILGIASTVSSRVSEDRKEKFFEMLHKAEGGTQFLATVANHIMDSVNPLLKFTHSVKRTAERSESLGSFIGCETCKASVYALDSAVRTKTITKALESFAVLVCDQMESTNTTVCPGAVTEMGDIIVPTLTNFLLSPDYICGRVLDHCQEEFVELS